MRISDWSSDVCSSDLVPPASALWYSHTRGSRSVIAAVATYSRATPASSAGLRRRQAQARTPPARIRSEEHTSELQSLMRISYAVFCLKKKKPTYSHDTYSTSLVLYTCATTISDT